jgi:hypothetical protein
MNITNKPSNDETPTPTLTPQEQAAVDALVMMASNPESIRYSFQELRALGAAIAMLDRPAVRNAVSAAFGPDSWDDLEH